jgi:aryl-alcohol dehydrogenase-like predicted oxidoreductase
MAKLGKTGIDLGMMGFGGWPIGGPFTFDGKEDGWGGVDDDESVKAIHAALDAGIRYIDTADVYGTGRSERVIGRAIKGRRDQVIISTKFGFQYDEDSKVAWAKYDTSPAYIRKACEASLRRLGTDYIDLYLFHVGGDVPPGELGQVIATLDDLKAEGKIRAYGWSNWKTEAARWFADRSAADAMMFELNVLHGETDMVGLCEEKDLAAVCISPLAMGFLSGKYGRGTKFSKNDVRGAGHSWVTVFRNGEPVPELLEKLEAVREILTTGGRSLVQGALAWIWAKSPNAVPIPGIKTAAQAAELAGAMAHGPLTREQFLEVERLMGRLPAGSPA